MKNKKFFIITLVLTFLICLVAFSVDRELIKTIDSWFYDIISNQINPNLTLFMRFATEVGSVGVVIILCLSFFLFSKVRKNYALPVATTVAITFLSNLGLKTLFARERPNILQLISESYYSFPSGHAMINMAFYTMVFMITKKHVDNKKTKLTISIICIIIPLVIGISRIYLGVHYTSDVVAGWVLGFVISIIVFNLFEGWNKLNNLAKGYYSEKK